MLPLVGRETVVGIRRGGGDGQSLDLLITPVSYGAISGLSYDAWRNEANRKVEEMSGGRLGYIHLPNTAVEGNRELYKGFYAQSAKDGLILDDRYNGGGFLDIASELAYMIAGPGITAGRTFEMLQFNSKHPSTNPVTGDPLQPERLEQAHPARSRA